MEKNTASVVSCEVESCKYHGFDCKCHAEGITVESPAALRKGETFCGTFAPRSAFGEK